MICECGILNCVAVGRKKHPVCCGGYEDEVTYIILAFYYLSEPQLGAKKNTENKLYTAYCPPHLRSYSLGYSLPNSISERYSSPELWPSVHHVQPLALSSLGNFNQFLLLSFIVVRNCFLAENITFLFRHHENSQVY